MEIEQLPKDEAIRRLRTLGQPATLFGEVGLALFPTSFCTRKLQLLIASIYGPSDTREWQPHHRLMTASAVRVTNLTPGSGVPTAGTRPRGCVACTWCSPRWTSR
jgi:hypothetical protein